MFSSVFLSESHNLASHWQVNFDRFISIDPSPLLLQTGSTRGSKKPKSHRLVLDNPFFLMIFVCTSSYLKIETEQSHASKKVYGLMFEIFDWLILQYPLSGGRGVDFQWAHSLLVRLVAIEIFTQTDSNQSLLTYNVWLQHGNVVLQKKKKRGDWIDFILLEQEVSMGDVTLNPSISRPAYSQWLFHIKMKYKQRDSRTNTLKTSRCDREF